MVGYVIGSRNIEVGADKSVHAQRRNLGNLIYRFIEEALCIPEAKGVNVDYHARTEHRATREAATG